MKIKFALILLILSLVKQNLVTAQEAEQIHVFRGATIFPISGEPIENGDLVIRGKKILAVGKTGSVAIPANAVIHDVKGKVIMPGLVDTHSHIGGGDGGDGSAPIHPDVRIYDTIDPNNDTFNKARAGGITTVNVMPGSGHLMSGQTVYLKLRQKPRKVDDMLFVSNPQKEIIGGLKMANGTNPLRPSPFPGTRAKSAAIIRQLYSKAVDYQSKIKAAKGDSSKLPPRDIMMEPLVEVLEGKRTVHHHTHRGDDILTVIRIAKEFGYRPVLHHVSEAWKVAKEIAEAKIPCSIIILDTPGGKLEAAEIKYENGAVLEAAGVDVAFHTDDGVTDSRVFLRSAALAVRAGMSKKKALEGLTLAGAKMLGLENRVGSLDAGKDADFIILSGDPLSVYSRIEQTWVEGANVFDYALPEFRKYAAGGYGVYRGEIFDHYLGGYGETGSQTSNSK
ncbi:MAG: amidohydrolase family protein [Chloroherpetonaceae bacterium]|nr:amidohydrolase family protein [Chloroherpetonaceae bacterium]